MEPAMLLVIVLLGLAVDAYAHEPSSDDVKRATERAVARARLGRIRAFHALYGKR